jgi:hypothetical protein
MRYWWIFAVDRGPGYSQVLGSVRLVAAGGAESVDDGLAFACGQGM